MMKRKAPCSDDNDNRASASSNDSHGVNHDVNMTACSSSTSSSIVDFDLSGIDLSAAASININTASSSSTSTGSAINANNDSCEHFVKLFQRHLNFSNDDVNDNANNHHHHHCHLGYVESLDVSRCRLGPNGTSNLLSFLTSTSRSYSSTPTSPSPPLPLPPVYVLFNRLKKLTLQRNAIGSQGGRALGILLTSLDVPVLEILDISLNDIKAGGGEPTAAKVISDALIQSSSRSRSRSTVVAPSTSSSSLKVLIMDKCALGPEGANHLSHALHQNKCNLITLDLTGNMIGPIGANNLFIALQSNSTLKELKLRMNRIGGCSDKYDIQSLSTALMGGCSYCCSLIKLDLSYNDLRCEGCIILSQALINNNMGGENNNNSNNTTTLTELLLEKNDIASMGGQALADALGRNTTVKKLVLAGNAGIGDEGAIAMGTMLKVNNTLEVLDLSSCSIGNEGGASLGHGLGENTTLECLNLDKNSLGFGKETTLFSVGVSVNKSLKELHLSGNGFASTEVNGEEGQWGKSISEAFSNNSTLNHVDLSNNALSDSSIVDAVASAHSSIEYFDISDNSLEYVSIETQLLLSKRMVSSLSIDMSLNPLSSPPLGRLATHSNLQSYLVLLANEKTAVTRIRLMVLGYGGVGKSTFCRAITNEDGACSFQSSLVPVQEWVVDRVKDWAGRLGTVWSKEAVKLIVDEGISGKDLKMLIDTSKSGGGDDSGNLPPSKILLDLCASKYPTIDADTLARAISALSAKGYLSTVGAVKVDGTIGLGDRTCSLVDFAGQVEFLVSHQLLLSSMHTLCMIIQPAPSFGKRDHRHFGSWEYWSNFLSSLGDRRRGSLLLAVSQLDKMDDGYTSNARNNAESVAECDFASIKERSAGAISGASPLKLDYNPKKIMQTIADIKATLSTSLDQVAHSWWVPLSYETLSDILQDVAKQKLSDHELPILTRNELIQEIDSFCAKSPCNSILLSKMKTDRKLLDRAINYLEAVGDIMQAGKEWLLIDPIGWFSSFLAHFIKDDLAVSTVQVDATALRRQRGAVSLDEIVNALGHDYKSPQEHVSQIMSLLCGLELCIPLKSSNGKDMTPPADSPALYLFPCLLPSLISHSELANCDGTMRNLSPSAFAVRGHRFREKSGFLPPGLFVGILARLYQRLQSGVMHPSRMWNDHAILLFNNKATHVLLRLDLENAIIDVIGYASKKEQLFVGAAKGQASCVVWLTHLIKMFLRVYSQLKFDESWLCPNPKCHAFTDGWGCNRVPSDYRGKEFALAPIKQSRKDTHDCDIEGCYRFLGKGHSLERMKLCADSINDVCQTCNCEPVFKLREIIN